VGFGDGDVDGFGVGPVVGFGGPPGAGEPLTLGDGVGDGGGGGTNVPRPSRVIRSNFVFGTAASAAAMAVLQIGPGSVEPNTCVK